MRRFAPRARGPLFAPYGATTGTNDDGDDRRRIIRRYARVVVPFAIAFAITVFVVSFQALQDPGLSTYWHRTIAEQGGRDSPFSVWGQDHSLRWLQALVKAALVGLAVLVAFRPRRRDHVTVAALGAAVAVGTELTVAPRLYLYIPRLPPLLLLALLA